MNISFYNMSKNTISVDLEKLSATERGILFGLLHKGAPDLETDVASDEEQKQKVIQQLQELTIKDNNIEIAWILQYNKPTETINIVATRPYAGSLAFETYEKAVDAIALIGANRLKKFIFEAK